MFWIPVGQDTGHRGPNVNDIIIDKSRTVSWPAKTGCYHLSKKFFVQWNWNELFDS